MGCSGKTICGNPKARVIFSNRKPKVSFLSVRDRAKCLFSPFLVNTAWVVLTRAVRPGKKVKGISVIKVKEKP